MLELVNFSLFFEHHRVLSSIPTTHGHSWLMLTGMAVSQDSDLLGPSYHLYRLAGTNDTAVLRAIGYALPAVMYAQGYLVQDRPRC